MKYPLFLSFINPLLLAATVAAETTKPSATAVDELRLVTIGGAATEIVFALGAGASVVGVDQSSQYPEAVCQLPSVGYVRTISAEGVLSLEPDLVVATSALAPENARQQLEAVGVELLIVPDPKSPDELFAGIDQIGERLKRTSAAEREAAKLRAAMKERKTLDPAPRVLFLMRSPGQDTLVAAGTGTKAEGVIELAGGRNVVNTHRSYRPISTESLLVLQPDVILVGVAETVYLDEMAQATLRAEILENDAWQSVSAVQSKQVHIVPLGATLSFGTRLATAVTEVNRIFVKAAQAD